MAWADLAILGIIGLSAVLSLFRGFVREAIALAGWIAGLWLAFNFVHVGAEWFERWVDSREIRLALGFVTLLAAVLVMAGVAGRLAGGLVDVTGLGATDRVLGMIFGAGRGAVIVSGIVLLAGFTDMVLEPWWRESVLLPRFEAFAAEVERILPAELAQRLHR
jgi:membrane protein required for colicin V production